MARTQDTMGKSGVLLGKGGVGDGRDPGFGFRVVVLLAPPNAVAPRCGLPPMGAV